MHRPRLEAAQKPPYDGINGNGRLLSRNFRKMNNSLKDRLVRHMEDGHYEPQSKSELARALNVDSRQKQDFRAIVDQLEEEGRLVRLQKGRYALKRERRNLVHGMIRILRSGKILFLPKKGDPAAADLGWDLEAIPELELKPNHLGTALDGDRVAVRVERKAAKGRRNVRRDRFSSPDTGMKARVEEVTERARSRWLGVFRAGKNKLGRVLGDGVGSPEYIELVEKPAMEVLPGQLVSVEPVSRGEEKKAPRGKIVEVLGYPDDPHVDMEAVIRKYDLPVEFPASVLQEVESFRKNPSSAELGRREDWTDSTVITTDIASEGLLSFGAEALAPRIELVIDHHGSNSLPCENRIVLADRAACGEIVYALLLELGAPVSKETAETLYVAISTDTGCFKYSNVTGNTLRVAAELIDLGADVAPINKIFFDTKTFARLKLEARLTAGIELYAGGMVGLCTLPQRWIDELSISEDDIDSISGFARSIEGVEIGIMIREVEGGMGKLSLRTSPRYDACALCQQLGGGGHAAAAGASVAGGIEGAKKAILDVLAQSGIRL